jgi:hypothetical protein
MAILEIEGQPGHRSLVVGHVDPEHDAWLPLGDHEAFEDSNGRPSPPSGNPSPAMNMVNGAKHFSSAPFAKVPLSSKMAPGLDPKGGRSTFWSGASFCTFISSNVT